MCAIEDAGFEIRDVVMWVYGSGFPKSHNVSMAIDKAAGAKRAVIGKRAWSTPKMEAGQGVSGLRQAGGFAGEYDASVERLHVPITAPATDAAKQWDGWGTALKPAWEPVIVARKPLEGTVAANVLEYGTGGLNIDGCRVETVPRTTHKRGNVQRSHPAPMDWGKETKYEVEGATGRWPANLIHDGSDEVLELFPFTKGPGYYKSPEDDTKTCTDSSSIFGTTPGNIDERRRIAQYSGDSGSAARFFYCAKASRSERDAGLESLPLKSGGELTDRKDDSPGTKSPRAGAGRTSGGHNTHPTVKPVALMRYLCRLVTPPNGVILDPFVGSGSTLVAAQLEGFRSIGIDIEQESCDIAQQRTEHTTLSGGA